MGIKAKTTLQTSFEAEVVEVDKSLTKEQLEAQVQAFNEEQRAILKAKKEQETK